MKTAGILVVYSEAFADTAIHLFALILRRIDQGASIVVVNNNQRLHLQDREGITVLRGNNVLHEFGAWQTGLDHVRGLAGSDALQGVVFANDTYCHYRSMGTLEQAAFARGAQQTARAARIEARGELAFSPEKQFYEFMGARTNRWIATYLFCINRAGLQALGWQVHPPMADVQAWAPCDADEEAFFSRRMPRVLRHHFCAWLFGRDTLPRWRRCAPLDAHNHAMMRGKAYALVCEQWLSLELLRQGGQIKSVFHDPLIFPLRRLLNGIARGDRL